MRVSKVGAAASGISLSRFSGLIRSVLITNVLGIGLVGDAFAAAQRIPNILQNLFGEGALSAAFVPEYSRISDDDPDQAGRLAGGVASFLICLVACLTAIGFLAAKPLTKAVAWGFTGERFDLTVRLVRIILLGSGVLVISAWCLAVLNSHGRLFLSYAAPVIWNLAQITVLITLALYEIRGSSSAEKLAWALVIGSVLQVLIQIPSVLRQNPHIRLNIFWKDKSTALVLKRFFPAILGRGALQLSSFIDLALASLLSLGAASSLAAAQTLYLLPVALIATSVVAAELPELSRSNDVADMSERLSRRLLQMLWFVGPVLAMYLAAGHQIADALFNLGGFRVRIMQDDLAVIGLTLAAYSLALPALMSSRLLQSACFSSGDTKTPARIATLRVLISLIAGAVLMFQFEQILILGQSLIGFGDLKLVWGPLSDVTRNSSELPARLGPVGLALGSALGAWFEFWLLRKHVVAKWGLKRLTNSSLWRHIVPTLFAFGAAVALRQLKIEQPLFHLCLIGVGVLVVYFGISGFCGTPSQSQLVSDLRANRANSNHEEDLKSL